MYYVRRWDNDEIVSSHKTLPIARRHCRGNGHTGEIPSGATGYAPLCYVANKAGELVYNPRFSANIRSGVGSWVNSQRSDAF